MICSIKNLMHITVAGRTQERGSFSEQLHEHNRVATLIRILLMEISSPLHSQLAQFPIIWHYNIDLFAPLLLKEQEGFSWFEGEYQHQSIALRPAKRGC